MYSCVEGQIHLYLCGLRMKEPKMAIVFICSFMGAILGYTILGLIGSIIGCIVFGTASIVIDE